MMNFLKNNFLAGITQKQAVNTLFSFSLWSLKKRELGFTEKVKRKRF